MKNLLSDLRKEFDYVLIDSPAGIDGGFKLATADSDRIIVVTTPQIAAIHDADCVIQLLHRKKVPRIDLLVNGYRRQMVRDGNMLDIPDICELLGSGASGCCSGRRGDYHQPEPRGTGDREAYGFRHLLPEYCTAGLPAWKSQYRIIFITKGCSPDSSGGIMPESWCRMCHRSKGVAKERLKLMIDSRRKQLDDETMAQIRHEIGEIVTRYVDIEPENVEIKIILKDYICSNNTN